MNIWHTHIRPKFWNISEENSWLVTAMSQLVFTAPDISSTTKEILCAL